MLAGRHTVMVTGTMWARGAGLGSATNLGDSRLITMAVGHSSEADGDGALDLIMRDRFMVRPSSGFWVEVDGASTLVLGLAAESVGSRLVRVSRFIRGITPAEPITAM